MRVDHRTKAESQIDLLKGRIAEALVEGMFRQAGYDVSRTGRESQPQRVFKRGRDEFLPDFTLRRDVERPGSDRPLHHLIPIEIKYRRDISRFLNVEAPEFLENTKNWRGLYLILVTEHPDAGRSVFQVLAGNVGAPSTCDLHTVALLNIYRSTVLAYEGIALNLFKLMAEHRSAVRKIARS